MREALPAYLPRAAGIYSRQFTATGAAAGTCVKIAEPPSWLERDNVGGTTATAGAVVIKPGAFLRRTDLGVARELAEGVVEVGSFAYSGCTGLSGVLVLPSTTQKIG